MRNGVNSILIFFCKVAGHCIAAYLEPVGSVLDGASGLAQRGSLIGVPDDVEAEIVHHVLQRAVHYFYDVGMRFVNHLGTATATK